MNVLEIAAFRAMRILERRDLHRGDRHAGFATRKDLAAVGRERHASTENSKRPAPRLLVRAPAFAERDDDAARALQFV